MDKEDSFKKLRILFLSRSANEKLFDHLVSNSFYF